MGNELANEKEYKIFSPSGDKDFEIYKRSIPFWANHFSKLLMENIPLKPGSKILDVATGTGVPLLDIAKKIDGDSGSAIIGIDIWEAAIFEAKKRINASNLYNASVIKADGNNLPFLRETFDYVLSNVGINNFADRETVFAELNRVNKKHGYLILTTNLENCMHEFYYIYSMVLNRLGNKSYIESLQKQKKERVTITELKALYIRNGYKLNRLVEREFKLTYPDSKSFFNNDFIGMGFMKNWIKIVETRDKWDKIQVEIMKEIERVVEKKMNFTLTIPFVYIEGQKI